MIGIYAVLSMVSLVIFIICITKISNTMNAHKAYTVFYFMSCVICTITSVLSVLRVEEYCRVPTQVKCYQLPNKVIAITNDKMEFTFTAIADMSVLTGKDFEVVYYENSWGVNTETKLKWRN